MNALITISEISIRQDKEGRYCLNDLHKASGGKDKDKSSNWLRQQQVIDLVGLLESEQSKGGIPPILTKQGHGTYAAKELIYAYAMWISPEFHIKVIRAYDALVTGSLPAATLDIDRLAQQIGDRLKNSAPASALLPKNQQKEIYASLDKLMALFHPLSQPFSDLLTISRVLQGLDARTGMKEPGYQQALDLYVNRKAH
jgi:hypothetical protein